MGRTKEKRRRSAQQINDDQKGNRHKELDSIKNLFERGNASKGYSELINYIEKYPTDAYGHNLLGKILLKNNDFQGAIREFDFVVNANERNRHSGLFGMARAYHLLGDLDNARIYYEEAIKDNPFGHMLPYLALANLESEEHNYYRALNILHMALELDDANSKKYGAGCKNDVQLEIVKNLIYLGKEDEAEDILKDLIPESHNQEREIAYRRGVVYRDKKQYPEALMYLEKARNISQKDVIYYQATLELARLYQQMNFLDEQYTCLEELYDANMDFNGDVSILLGTARLAKKNYTGAKECFERGMTSTDFASRNLSTFYYSSLQHLEGDILGAQTTLKNTLAKNKAPYPLNYMTLIRLLYDDGEYQEARRYIAEIREKDSNIDDDYSFRRLEILIDKAEGKPLPSKSKYGYIESQFVSYSKADAIRHIEQKHTNKDLEKSTFPHETSIKDLLDDVQIYLVEENKLMHNVLDEYQIEYPGAGYINGGEIIANHIRIKTIPGTKQIVTMHPCTESLLPTRGAIKKEKAKEKVKENAQISKFNARFAKFQNK